MTDNSFYGLNEKKCANCGKTIFPTPEHAYKEGSVYFCKWTCMTAYRREREHARQITSKAVLQYSYDGKTLIKRFDSVKEAADAVGARHEYAIRYAALHGTSYQKYRWKYE